MFLSQETSEQEQEDQTLFWCKANLFFMLGWLVDVMIYFNKVILIKMIAHKSGVSRGRIYVVWVQINNFIIR